MRLIKYELKIMGPNSVLILISVAAALALSAVFGGELLRLSPVGFEVIFPVFSSVAVSEWGRFRADGSFDVIAAQSPSVFRWVLCRFSAVFAEVSLFALGAMLLVSFLSRELPVSEMLLLYFPPAFFLSTAGALLGMCLSREHASTLVCGMLWLTELMCRSLLRLPGAEYFYLFLRFAGDPDNVWPANRAVLCALGLLLWFAIFQVCHRRSRTAARRKNAATSKGQ